jgi:hypothetical protein
MNVMAQQQDDVIVPNTIEESAQRLLGALSTKGLHELRNPIVEGLKREDALPAGAAREHGFRRHADFRIWCDAIEAELKRRNESFTEVDWSPPKS